MPVNQRVSAPWSSPFCWSDCRLHATGFGSFHSPTLLTGFVGECSFVGEFGVSLESAFSILIGRRHMLQAKLYTAAANIFPHHIRTDDHTSLPPITFPGILAAQEHHEARMQGVLLSMRPCPVASVSPPKTTKWK